jgi:hypothetical protein
MISPLSQIIYTIEIMYMHNLILENWVNVAFLYDLQIVWNGGGDPLLRMQICQFNPYVA